jgi:peptide/nickel transport system permease protein
MIAYIIRRLLQGAIIILLVTLISFLLLQLIPGDPVRVMLGTEATEDEIQRLRHELWLDRPVVIQYLHWLSNVFQGNFGKSIIYKDEITTLAAQRLPVTLHLGFVGLLFSLLGIPVGVVSAIRRGRFADSILTTFANIGISIPIFWLGILGIYLFGLALGWLPIQGYTSPFEDFWTSCQKAFMPAVCLAVIPLAGIARQARSSMLEVIRQDYIRTARSMGLKEHVVIISHALKNSLIPVVTLLGTHVRLLLGGSVLVETVFNIPGMGRLIVRGVFDSDFIIVQFGILVIAFIVTLTNLLVDISYGWLDPRTRLE